MIENINSIYSKRFSLYFSEYLTMLLISICLVGITVGSHNIGIPLYKINPMHWILYYVVILKKPAISTIAVLAIALPFTSSILTGHPVMIKSFLICLELLTYGIVFSLLFKSNSILIPYLLSQIAGHTIYYSSKYYLIKAEIFNSIFISSSIFLQLLISIVMGISIILFKKHQNKISLV